MSYKYTTDFSYTPPEDLETRELVTPDFSKPFDPKRNEHSPHAKVHRNIYKFVSDYCYEGKVDDFLNQPKYSGLFGEYKAYQRKRAKMRMPDHEYQEWLEQESMKTRADYQIEIAKEVHAVAKMLIQKYEYLDFEIHDEDIDVEEDEFNYQGFSPLMRYASPMALNKRLLPQFNEYSKWLYILFNLSDSELRRLNNPYVRELFINKMFVHPLLGIKYDIKLDPTRTSYGNKRVVNTVRKRFESSIENQNTAIREGDRCEYEEKIARLQSGYFDGEELYIAVNMYMFALKYNNSMVEKYPKNGTTFQASTFLGYAAKGSLSARKVEYSNDAEAIANALENQNQYEFTERQLEIMEGTYQGKRRWLNAHQLLLSLLSVGCEEILMNSNARNVAGPIYLLQAYERGTWQELEEEVQAKEVKIVIEDKGIFKA